MTASDLSSCFLIDCIAKYAKDKVIQDHFRFPQYLFNELHNIRPDITGRIVATQNDFYYDEKLEGEKWRMVSELW